jgi:hypothetical protein
MRHQGMPIARWLRDTRAEVIYGSRALRRNRLWTAAAVLTLGIGIGVTTAIYSVVDTVLLRPLPLPDVDRLVRILERAAT